MREHQRAAARIEERSRGSRKDVAARALASVGLTRQAAGAGVNSASAAEA
ncbi:MAG: hypothetical protein K1X87_11405 [Dehalococcoidia bacterium]|nr:hypothetical protein [Dehalococcoidia bacterium]